MSYLVEDLVEAVKRCTTLGCNVFKIFKGSENTLYAYKSFSNPDAPYETKITWTKSKFDAEKFQEIMHKIVRDMPGITCAILTKKANGFRFRYSDEDIHPNYKYDLWNYVLNHKMYVEKQLFSQEQEKAVKPNLAVNPTKPTVCPESDVWGVPVAESSLKTRKVEKKMNDFSIENLKNAFVNKVTHLDKKTVTILAIVALILLIVGKYTDLKDIANGIKDKVKRSKNFKAMVDDGNNAINALKKIVGVKKNDEA